MENINKWLKPKLKKHIKYSNKQIWNQIKTETLFFPRLKQLKKQAITINEKIRCDYDKFIGFLDNPSLYYCSTEFHDLFGLSQAYKLKYNCILYKRYDYIYRVYLTTSTIKYLFIKNGKYQ